MTTEELYKDLGIKAAGPRVVLAADNTTTQDQPRCLRSDAEFADDVDRLFGQRPGYILYKKEKPEHRMVLWMTLQAQKPKEIAAALRITVQVVRNVQHQPWFQDAFCKLSAEMGKDALQTLLKTEATDAVLRTIELAKTADSDAVKLAANKEILDRFLGKPVVKAEVKTESTVDIVVQDAASLIAERDRLNQQMRANGLLTGTN